ncbi:MAG: choice-of-anchor J domain-containing protein [Clostridia bacterium]|nr:choice-of-anchor J domain-containing protein [Clostridia bacterium]
MTWTYTKDNSVNPTGDYFAVDNVSIGEAPDVTVTFVDGINGETIDTLTVQAGTVLTEDMFPEAPEHTGYIFDGWDYNGEAVTVDTTITAMYHDPNSIIWDFETDPISQGFQFIDQDGDGFNWQWHVNTGSGNHTTHSGDGVATSASYDNDSEAALNPDNWMITPDFTGTLLTFWLVAQDTSWANDYLEVYVTTDGGETWSDALWSGFSPTEYTQYSIDLSAYSGTKNVAFRHFNCTDMFMLNVDDIEVSGGSTPPEPQIITEVDVIFDIPEYGATPDFTPEVPEGAHYSISDFTWNRYDGENDIIMTEDDVFDDPNSVYYIVFELTPEEGWDFAEDCTATVNGQAELFDFGFPFEGYFYGMSVEFTVEAPAVDTFGDVDLDGNVEAEDALLAMRYAMGLIELTDEQLVQMDVNGDGVYDLVDAVLILRYAMGLIDQFPIELE